MDLPIVIIPDKIHTQNLIVLESYLHLNTYKNQLIYQLINFDYENLSLF